MQFLKAILLIVCVSGFAHAESRTRIADYKSDYLCYFLDTEGFHTDEGYAISVLPDSCVDLRFIEEPYVKYALDCHLDIVATRENNLVVKCSYPQNRTTMTFTLDKLSLEASAEINVTPIDVFKMKCQTNR